MSVDRAVGLPGIPYHVRGAGFASFCPPVCVPRLCSSGLASYAERRVRRGALGEDRRYMSSRGTYVCSLALSECVRESPAAPDRVSFVNVIWSSAEAGHAGWKDMHLLVLIWTCLGEVGEDRLGVGSVLLPSRRQWRKTTCTWGPVQVYNIRAYKPSLLSSKAARCVRSHR